MLYIEMVQFEKVTGKESYTPVDYMTIIKTSYQGDIEQVLQGKILYQMNKVSGKNVYEYRLIVNNQQIGECLIRIKENLKEWSFSTISIMQNLQQKGIMTDFVLKIVRPAMKELHPGCQHVRNSYQEDLGIKMRDKIERIEYDKRNRDKV